MTAPYRAISLLILAVLGGCMEDAGQVVERYMEQSRHPLDRYLSQLGADTVSPLPRFDWPAGTLLCPTTPYQSSLHSRTPVATRVNAFLKRKEFRGDEGHWSVVVVAPLSSGDGAIEHLIFKRGNYAVFTSPEMLGRDGPTLPAGFVQQECVPVETGRVLAARGRLYPKIVAFGVAGQ
ncbi:hypothetical protein [Pseudoduganella albidiflava]|uniref:Uncharacterized protein n=1 Tax=Pseudoduganella albidiflava TaxID=321983 RepID=A0A411WYH9_9BURK|nr:hypothetical protein [Pseudoduganella albidiflava]QBI01754.1 hypothetical protein EYF70_13510 [Pseudoduganella albidiflava]GGY39951.1 hypothetical protein GCM10007387_22620 [Pseudoduganella albidiflava]